MLEKRPLLYVRINALDTPLWEVDLAGVMGARPDGILLPKARSGEDVHKLSIALHHAEEHAGTPTGATRIVVIAARCPSRSSNSVRLRGLQRTRLEGLTWGAEDLAAAVGAQTNREADGSWTSPYHLARNLCLFTAVAANAQPIDTVFVNFRDEPGFRREASAAARDGFTGKMAIPPNQVAAINEIFTPKPEEVARAQEIVKAFADHPDAGVLAIAGHMVDRAHVKGAERMLARAKSATRG